MAPCHHHNDRVDVPPASHRPKLHYWKAVKKLYVITSLILRARVLIHHKMLGNVAHEWLGMIEPYPVSPPSRFPWSIIPSDLNWAPILNKGGVLDFKLWAKLFTNCSSFFIWSICGEFLELLPFGNEVKKNCRPKPNCDSWSNLKEMDFICNQPSRETWERHSKQWLICCRGTLWPCSPLVLFTQSKKKADGVRAKCALCYVTEVTKLLDLGSNLNISPSFPFLIFSRCCVAFTFSSAHSRR